MKSCARWWRVFNVNCTVKHLFGQISHGNGDKYPLKTTVFEKLHVFYCETNATCASFSIPTENHVDR